MPKVTIYVPDDLKARMDDAGELNWSGLAQRAFDAEMQRQERRQQIIGELNMEQVVERLRESKKRGEADDQEAGFKAGVDWAKEWAEWNELCRAAEFDSDHYLESHAEAFTSWVVPSGDPDACDFWEAIDGDQFGRRHGLPSESFVIGFHEGARSIWLATEGEV